MVVDVSESAISAFLSVLALAAGAMSIALVVSWATRTGAGVRRELAPYALPLALAVSTTATLGSLYYSEIADFPPCKLCWYQRIAMYPLALVLGIAALRRDVGIRWYALPLAVIGIGISTYHYLLERFPDSISAGCSLDIPCDTVWVWKFGFLSIPGMAWVGFALVITLLLLARPSPRPTEAPPESTPEPEPASRAQEVPA
jgi:disulfide bond formation protein DsbB